MLISVTGGCMSISVLPLVILNNLYIIRWVIEVIRVALFLAH